MNIKIGKISAINGNKVNVLFAAYDNEVTEDLPVIIPYVNAEKAIIKIDDIVIVGYTKDGTGIVLGHL